MCAKTTTAPLDRLKILLQAQNEHYRNYRVLQGLLAVGKKEGFLGYYNMIQIFYGGFNIQLGLN